MTLLTAMENCGKEIADGQAREAVKELGIGTPATRAAIITTLFKRDYICLLYTSVVMDATLQLVRKDGDPLLEILGIKPVEQ